MANPNLKPWPKGVSGNPSGRVALPPELVGIKSLSQHEVTKLVSKYARMNKTELLGAVNDEGAPVLEVAIASIFVQAVKQGDFTRLGWLLDRAIGKVPSSEPDDGEKTKTPFAQLSDEELLALVRGGKNAG